MLTQEVLTSIDRSVLCWLATVDADGHPNVSPKEAFVTHGSHELLIANIASPASARNIASQPKVCVSFVDIFVQKGYKLKGVASVIEPSQDDFLECSRPLETITQGQFPIQSIFRIRVTAVHPIIAPSYWMFPSITEASQVESALRTYGVQKIE